MVQVRRKKSKKGLRQIKAWTKILSIALLPSIILYGLCYNNNDAKNISSNPKLGKALAANESKEYRARQMKRGKRKLPDHCSTVGTGVVKEVIIKGERHTGTNWIESILRQNLYRSPPVFHKRQNGEKVYKREKVERVKVFKDSPKFGWKHGFLPPLGWGFPISESEVLLVITRDVFTWLPKMYEISYDKFMNEKGKTLSFSDFIRSQYLAQCHPTPGEAAALIRRTKSHQSTAERFCSRIKKEGEQFDPDTVIAEQAENIVQIRTQKYMQWLSDKPDEATYKGSKGLYLQNRIHIQLESLSPPYGSDIAPNDLQNQLIGDRLNERCVQTYDKFDGIVTKRKWKRQIFRMGDKDKAYDVLSEKQKLLSIYSKDDLRFVLDQLDFDFERKIGYTYNYVYKMLEEKVSVLDTIKNFIT